MLIPTASTDRRRSPGPGSCDVLRSGAAAATDQPRPRGQEPWDLPREVRRVGGIDEAPLDARRQARVGHDQQWRQAGHVRDPDERVQASDRTAAAVHAKGVDTCCRQRGGRHLRRGAVHRREFLTERHRGDQRQVGPGTDGGHDQQQLVEDRRRLRDEEVHAALEEAVHLLLDRCTGRRDGDAAGGPDGRRQGPDGAGHEDIPSSRHVACLAGHLCSAPIEAPDPCLQSEGCQPEPVRREGVGLDDVRAGRDRLPVDGADQLRPALDELLEAGALGHAMCVEEGAHGAVKEHRRVGEPLSEGGAGAGARDVSHGLQGWRDSPSDPCLTSDTADARAASVRGASRSSPGGAA